MMKLTDDGRMFKKPNPAVMQAESEQYSLLGEYTDSEGTAAAKCMHYICHNLKYFQTKHVIKTLQDGAVLQTMLFGLIYAVLLQILCCICLSKTITIGWHFFGTFIVSNKRA